MTPAGRSVVHALELLAEMPADPKLQEAKESLFHAADLIEQYAAEQRRQAETIPPHAAVPSELADTDPAELAPESAGAE